MAMEPLHILPGDFPHGFSLHFFRQVLRLKGKGLVQSGNKRGDLYVPWCRVRQWGAALDLALMEGLFNEKMVEMEGFLGWEYGWFQRENGGNGPVYDFLEDFNPNKNHQFQWGKWWMKPTK